jgi:hypothetical protein
MSMDEKKNLKGTMGETSEELLQVIQALSQVYPLIVLSNLTQNKYFLVLHDGFLYNDIPHSGNYDNLIDDNVDNIHINYQALFEKCFSREHLLRSYQGGKTEVYAEIYQKNKAGQYQWVSTRAIRLPDNDGDVCQICFCRVLDGIVEERHRRK